MHQKNQNEEKIEEAAKPDDPAEKEVSLRYENRRQVAKGGILGFFIGLAVIVPGVSGSAVAIIFRLYEKLLYALGNLFRKFGVCRVRNRVVAAGKAAPGYGPVVEYSRIAPQLFNVFYTAVCVKP